MFIDLIYGMFMISVLYISADLIKKYKTGMIKNNSDLAMYFAKKTFKALKMYNKTKKNTNILFKKCLKNNNKKNSKHVEKNEEVYKMVCMTNKGYMYKVLLVYAEDKIYLEDNENVYSTENNIQNKIYHMLKDDNEPSMFIFNKKRDKAVKINLIDFDITNFEKMMEIKNKVDTIEEDDKLFVNVQIKIDKDYDITDAMEKYYCDEK